MRTDLGSYPVVPPPLHLTVFSRLTVAPCSPQATVAWCVCLPGTPFPADHRGLEGSWCLTFSLSKAVPIVLSIPTPCPGFPHAGDWHSRGRNLGVLQPPHSTHPPCRHLQSGFLLSTLPPPDTTSSSLSFLRLPRAAPASPGLLGRPRLGFSLSHFVSLIGLKSGPQLPQQMRKGRRNRGTSRASLRHRRQWN